MNILTTVYLEGKLKELWLRRGGVVSYVKIYCKVFEMGLVIEERKFIKIKKIK